MIHINNAIHTLKNEIMPLAATWMQLEITILSEVSQRKNYHMMPLICRI